jgi:hypothetical protein
MNRLLIAALLLSSVTWAQVEESNTETGSPDLKKQIQNPIANLISLPFQNNLDFGVGPDDRTRNTLNIQPVIPVSINENLNLVTRTIVPVISQPVGASDSKFGIGDTNLSLFLTSAKPKKTTIGYGLATGLPTATDPVLGSGKWTAGPSVVVLVQPGDWTIGGLAQNTWSYAGQSDRADVNLFYSQIFVVRNLAKGWYVNSAPIITANWEASSGNQWTVPIGAGAGKLFKAGNLPINAQVGYYYNVVTPDFGPDSQLRFQVVLLFPK